MGVVIGDIVHNLRSALDYMVWQLTLAEGHVPSFKVSGRWRKIAFPVFTEDPRKKDGSGNPIPWQAKSPDSLWARGIRFGQNSKCFSFTSFSFPSGFR